MTVAFRNVDVSDGEVERWPYEAIVTVIERGTIGDWAALGRAIASSPWGDVARQVEAYLSYTDEPGVGGLLRRRIAQARDEQKVAERADVSAMVRKYVARSGLSSDEFARAVGTSRPRLSTYGSRSGHSFRRAAAADESGAGPRRRHLDGRAVGQRATEYRAQAKSPLRATSSSFSSSWRGSSGAPAPSVTGAM